MMKKNLVSMAGIASSLLFGGLMAYAGSQQGIYAMGLPVFAVCCGIAFAVQWLLFIPAYIYQTERYFDLAGSLTYITVVILALSLTGKLFNGNSDPRALLIGAAVIIWACRLGTFLFLRISAEGEDKRFRTIKPDFLQFLMTWSLQGLWVTVTFAAGLAAITTAETQPLGLAGIAGAVLWMGGFVFEVVADHQKSRFKQANPDGFITSGLWRYSRHPNYFGEIILWIGIALLALPVLQGWQYLTLASPFFVILLLTQISGVRMLEHRANKKWGDDPAYQFYRSNTPVLVPRPGF